MKQEGDEAREYEAYGFVYIGAKQRGRRKKEGRKKIAAKFGDKIAAERIACPSGYIKRKTVAWVFAKREVGRVSQWLTSLPRYCPREKKKNKPRPHEISQYKNALCAASNRWFLLWNKCPRRISNRIESARVHEWWPFGIARERFFDTTTGTWRL